MRRLSLLLISISLPLALLIHFFPEKFLIRLAQSYFHYHLSRLFHNSDSKIYIFVYDQKGNLQTWNNTLFLPPESFVKTLIQKKQTIDTVLFTPHHILYCDWQPYSSDSNVLFILPLQITYRHKTILFQNVTYNPIPIPELSLHYSAREKENTPGFWLTNRKGNPQVFIFFSNIRQLTLPIERALWFLLLLATVLLIYLFSPDYVDYALSLLCLRIGLLFSHHFSSTLMIPLFSAQTLAVHTLIPSLGDLLINAFVFLLFIVKLPRFTIPSRRINQIISLLITFAFLVFYAQFIYQVLLNSKIDLTFQHLQGISLAHLFLITALLTPIYGLTHFLASTSSVLSISRPFAKKVLLLGLFLIPVILHLLHFPKWVHSSHLPEWFLFLPYSLPLTFMLFLYPLSEMKKIRQEFFLFVIACFLYAIPSLQLVNEEKLTYEYKKFVQFLNNPRDLFTEYYLEEIAINIQQDSVLQDSSSYSGILNYLFEAYYQNKIRGYHVGVYLYDRFYRLLASNETHPPFTSPHRLRSPIFPFTHVYSISYPRHLVGYYYAVKIPFVHSQLGKLYFYGECIPQVLQWGNESDLFLQESPLKIPTQISFAIYQNGSRIFQHGEVNFPLQFHRSLFSDSQTFQLGEERYAVIRPKPISLLTLFIHYTLFFALLFSCITLLFLLVNLRTYLRFVKVYFYTFRFRLYFLFFLTVFLLLFLYILLSPYLLKRYYYTTLKSEIVKKLESVQKRLEQELPHLSVLRNPQAYQYYIALNDFTAVYDLKGHLINARFPLFFRPPYFSHLISASVFQHSQYEQRWIESAPFGGTLFFSGYAVLFHKSRPIGYLWLLYPMENPELEKELNTTIALLFSIVFLFGLFLFTVSFSLSEQLVKPVRLLKFQLIRTVYGHERRPIPWRGKDEMASLIHAYNRMLQLLEESEQQLQLKARESAWQRIAQQIAHEIKNPLTPMKLSLQHLLRQLENPKHQQLVNTVLRQIENLHQIANTFSDFAKRLEHRKPLTKEPVRLSEILQEILALFSHHQTITMRLQNDIQNETFLEGNRADLQRAFLNLIQNAIQAIENEGTITVHLQEKEEHYLITIQDTGMGIPEEIRPHIFEPNFTTKSSGMGLGLAITKQIIEQHQGTITYETKVGHGTSFIIALPKKR